MDVDGVGGLKSGSQAWRWWWSVKDNARGPHESRRRLFGMFNFAPSKAPIRTFKPENDVHTEKQWYIAWLSASERHRKSENVCSNTSASESEASCVVVPIEKMKAYVDEPGRILS